MEMELLTDAHSPGHALFTLNGWEHLRRVLEGDGSLTEGVADGEEVNEPIGCQLAPCFDHGSCQVSLQDNGCELLGAGTVFLQQGKTSGKQEDTHSREGL
jgi:hypothetical protein